MSDPIKRRAFAMIRQLATDALRAAISDGACLAEPINWHSVRVSSVQYFEDDHGESGYTVIIDEASPSCSNLQLFVAKRMLEAGLGSIEVRTEW